MPLQASDEQVALPPSTGMERKEEGKGGKLKEPESLAVGSSLQDTCQGNVLFDVSFTRPKMKRKQHM